jgi:cytochrome bd-type quinol oxidase subunit 2
MSNHSGAHGHGEKAHASVTLYVVFAVILCVITYLEWWIFKHRESAGISHQAMVIALIIMSLVKFAMVCGWYMHLRYDHKSLTGLLIVGMIMASATFGVLHIIVHPKECEAMKGDCFKIGQPVDSAAPADNAAPADSAPAEAAPAHP